MLKRAYSLLQIKSVNDDLRVITGMATTPTPDRIGDIVEPLGVKYTNPLPLLWQHRSDKPIGTVRFDKPTEDGVAFSARMPTVDEPGALKERIDEAWQSVKLGLVRGVSIGFRSLDHSYMDDGGIRFRETEVLELSLVTIPANAEATIETIKSIDDEIRAASGRTLSPVERKRPGATGPRNAKSPAPKDARTMPRTIAEQISAFEATRAAKTARMNELMQKSADEGVTLDQAESDEYDTLEEDVQRIDQHLKRLRSLEQANKAAAIAVEKVDTPSRASELRGGVSVQVLAKQLPKGTRFTRYVIALANARGNIMQAHEIAKRWQDTPEVAEVLKAQMMVGTTDYEMFAKAAVEAGTTTDTTWAAPLVVYQNLQNEFIELLQPLTIIGRIPGLRRVPFKIKVPRQTGGATVNWIGEGKVKPVSSLAFDTVTLEHHKIAGIVPMTEELVRLSNPSAEMLVRDNLIAEIVKFMDIAFVDPAADAQAGVRPASITNGVTPVTATGATPDALRADLKTLVNSFLDGNLSMAGAVLLMTQQQAFAISLMTNALGQAEFPNIDVNGGRLGGLPVITSEALPATGSSPTDGYPIILVKAPEIMLADDGEVSIDASREASLNMDSAPDSPISASTTLISLWQHNMIAIKAERWVSWQKRRADAVGFIQYAKYADS
jgi:HK97 family phage major capsid protein/HK97 family phage prohead protease